MRFGHARPVGAGFITSGVLVVAVAGFTMAAASQSGTPGGGPVLTMATADGTSQQCEPLTPPPSPWPSVATPSPTGPPTSSANPSPTATGSSSGTPTATPSATSPSTDPPSGTGSPSPTADSSPSPTASVSPGTTATATVTATPTATATATSPDPAPSPGTSPASVSLCVAIQRTKSGVDRGQAALWVVSAWAKGGYVPDAVLRLTASPARLPGQFSFGCGSHDGTGTCDLGEVDASSAQRQLQARVTVPATATSVTSVRLTVTGSAAHLPTDPKASAAVSVKAPPPVPGGGSGTSTPTPSPAPIPSSAQVPVGNLPYLSGSTGPYGAGSTLSPGGNAAGLFPALTPSSQPAPASPSRHAKAKTVANTTALPLGAPVAGAQLAGLGVLALAFVLAVTRVSVRRRPAAAPPGAKPADSAKPADRPADSAKPAEAPDQGEAGGQDG